MTYMFGRALFYISSLVWPWSTTSPQPSTEHISDSDFYIAPRGQHLHDGRYQVHVKLGGGVYSTTWLVSDKSDKATTRYRAIKILSRDATEDCLAEPKRMLEIDALQRVRDHGEFERLPQLLDVFPITQSGQKIHLCLVMDLLGSDVGTFRRSAQNKALPHYTVRIIMRQVVEGLLHLHKAGIVHTDVKPDNMLFYTSMSDDDITQWVSEIPGEDHDKAHPLPKEPGLEWDCDIETAKRIKVKLVDLGQAQWVGRHPTVDQFSAFSLRAPEVILRSDFTPTIDIWTVGCIVFEMLVGRWLFHPVDGGEEWTLEDDHLAKMMEFTGNRFSEAMLERAAGRDQYFNGEGNLLRVNELFPVAIEDALRNYKILPQEEVAPAAEFIRYCIRLDPHERPSAEELLQHSWLRPVY